MSELGVYLGGEGANELGSYSGHRTYHDEHRPGVIETLLRRVQPTGFRIIGATKWSRIRKFRAHGPTGEGRNVRALILDAREANADVLALARDSDGDARRVDDITRAVTEHENQGGKPDIIGGVAIPVLEAWLLALGGEHHTEQLSKGAALSRFEQRHQFGKATEEVVAYVEKADLAGIPADAKGLARWIQRAQVVLAGAVATPP